MTVVPDIKLIVAGGIGSGKSTVTRLLMAAGAAVIHADEIGHLVLEPEGEAFAPVAARWPEVISNGAVDRSKLASIVFSDSDELAFLESITHPAIGRRIRELTELVDARFWVLEVPVAVDFTGPGWSRLVVSAGPDVRRERLLNRGMAPDDIERRMDSQLTDEQWMGIADYHIKNDGSLAELEMAVQELVEGLAEQS